MILNEARVTQFGDCRAQKLQPAVIVAAPERQLTLETSAIDTPDINSEPGRIAGQEICEMLCGLEISDIKCDGTSCLGQRIAQ